MVSEDDRTEAAAEKHSRQGQGSTGTQGWGVGRV